MTGAPKPTYRLGVFLRDIAGLVPEAPYLAAIWLGGRVDPALREAIMVDVARKNQCRYCMFTHHEWALHAGLDPAELAAIEAAGGGVGDVLQRLGAAGRTDPADVDRIVRVMTLMNLSGNTVDALLDRLRGRPVAGSRRIDELAVAGAFLIAAPPVAALLAVWRRQSPLALLRDFRRFSREAEGAAEAVPDGVSSG